MVKIFTPYTVTIRFELIFWVTSLVLLAFMNPGVDAHYSLCILKLAGFNKCPGCGLGHAISFLFHGEIKKSFEAHPLGIFAIVIIIARIYKLLMLAIDFEKIK